MARTYGRGTVSERRPGRFHARCSIGGVDTTVGTFPTRELAQAAIDATLRKVAEMPHDVAGESLQAFHLDWLAHRARDGHHRDVENDGHCSKRWARSTLGARALVTITPRDVRQWVGEQVALQDAARQTLANSLNLLRQCLEHACQLGRIDANPAVGVRLPKMAPGLDDPWTWLTASELDAVLDDASEARDAIAFAAYTGLRQGEQYGLRWADVDLRTGLVVVRTSWPGTKTTKAAKTRRVQLIEPALEAVERQRERHARGLYVWPQEDGKPHRPGTFERVRDHFDARLQAAGIARNVRWHDLRHTCASHLVAGTWAPRWVARALTIAEVAAWLGHGQATTAARYAHLCPEAVGGLVVRRQKPHALRDVRR